MNRPWAVQLTKVCEEPNLISCVSYHVSVWRNSGIFNSLFYLYIFFTEWRL